LHEIARGLGREEAAVCRLLQRMVGVGQHEAKEVAQLELLLVAPGSRASEELACYERSADECKCKGRPRFLGHALQKHAGRNPHIWGKLTGSNSTWHTQALKHFDDVLKGPGSFQRVTNLRGNTFLEKMLPDGRGVRLQLDFQFRGFIDAGF
jgi:hypothetical protein